jgi:hypothetical protein
MSQTKLSLARKNLIISGQGEFDRCHPGWGRENSKPFQLLSAAVKFRRLKS